MNNAKFLAYSESQNTGQMPAGQRFTVTWRVRNSGTTTWDSGYHFVHIHANTGSTLMTAEAQYPLHQVASQATVPPNAEVVLTLTMTAPSAANRSYFTDWQLRDGQGNLFGEILWLRLKTVRATNSASFVSYSESHDTNQMPVGQIFTATWRIRNSGNSTWGEGYQLGFNPATNHTRMAAHSSFTLGQVADKTTVAPGTDVNIRLTLTAPETADRRYRTEWQMRDPQGKAFGDTLWLWVVTKGTPATPPTGNNGCQFITNHTIPDGTPIEAGKSFVKQWVVRNTGNTHWGAGYHLVFVSGDTGMSASFSHAVPAAAPGAEVVLSVNMAAPPPRPKAYASSWRMHDDRDIPFGDPLWVKFFSTANLEGFNIQPYSQNDGRWKHHQLGFGPRTFGEFGCLITCFSMMLSGFGEEITPLALNNRVLQLPQGQGFNGSDVFFAAPAFIIDHLKYWGNFKPFPDTGATWATHDPNLLQKIDLALQMGQAVIAQVDTDPSNPYQLATEQHWVLLLARQGDDYLVLDPFVGQALSLMGRYGSGSGEQALKKAIKSALFYRSTRAALREEEPEEPPASDGRSDMDATAPDALVYTGPAWPFGHCLIGIHDRANRHPQKADHEIARGHFESVKVMSGVTVEEVQAYQAKFVLCRLFESWNGRHVPVDDFVRAVVPDMERLVRAGVDYYEFHNEPNLTHEGLQAAGVKGSWRNGAEFAQYFIAGRKKLRQHFPGIKVGFPGLSPGDSVAYQFGHDSGFRLNDMEFLEGAEAAVRAADFVCVHAYYVSMAEVRGAAIELVKTYRRRFPDKLLFVSEFSNPDPNRNVSAAEKGQQAKEFYRLCQQIPGVGGAYYFIISGSGWDHQALRRDSDGRSTGILETMFT